MSVGNGMAANGLCRGTGGGKQQLHARARGPVLARHSNRWELS